MTAFGSEFPNPGALSEWGPGVGDPSQFLGFLATHVTPDMLVADRPAQARLSDILNTKFYDSQYAYPINSVRSKDCADNSESSGGIIHHPIHGEQMPLDYPRIMLEQDLIARRAAGEGPGCITLYYSTFALNAPGEDYYFLHTDCLREVFSTSPTPFIRKEDIIKLPGDRVYMGTLAKVEKAGGYAQQYNYNTGEWEYAGFTHGIGPVRPETVAGRVVRKLLRRPAPSLSPLGESGPKQLPK